MGVERGLSSPKSMIIFIVEGKELLNLQNEDNKRPVVSIKWENAFKPQHSCRHIKML